MLNINILKGFLRAFNILVPVVWFSQETRNREYRIFYICFSTFEKDTSGDHSVEYVLRKADMEDVRISVYTFKAIEHRKVSNSFFYFTKQNMLPWGEAISCEVDGLYDIFKFKTNQTWSLHFSASLGMIR